MTTNTTVASMIRAELKKRFPGIKFSVNTHPRTGTVRIKWTDGPSVRQVEGITLRHEYGHFDGMDDMYHYTNRRDDIPQTEYIFCNRLISNDAYRSLVADFDARWGGDPLEVETDSDGSPFVRYNIFNDKSQFFLREMHDWVKEFSFTEDATRFQASDGLTGEEMHNLRRRFNSIDTHLIEQHA